MNHKNRIHSTKLFIISFLITAILLTIAFGIYHRHLLSKEQETALSVEGVKVPVFTAADNLNLLVIYDADLSGGDLFAAAVCCNAAKGEIYTCPFDLQIEVLSQDSRNTLLEKYKLRGTRGLRVGIEALLQKQFDAVIRLDLDGLWRLANAFSGVTVAAGDSDGIETTGRISAYRFLELFAQEKEREVLFYRLVEQCFSDVAAKEKAKQVVFSYFDTDLSAYTALQHQSAVEYLVQKQCFRRLSLPTAVVTQAGKEICLADADAVSLLQGVFG